MFTRQSPYKIITTFFKRLSDTAYIKYDAQKDEIEIAAGKVVLKNLNAD